MVVLNAVSNLPNFDFKGTNSLDQKVYMTSKPSIPSPEMRIESVPVKGRDSSYTITDGTYEDINITFGVRSYRGELIYQDTLNRLNEWLRVGWDNSLNEITFSEFPQWIFKVKYIEPYTWEYNPSTGEMTTVLSLVCDPFKYSDTYKDIIGVVSTPVPIAPREFKFMNNSMFRARIENNYQDIADVIRAQGLFKVLDDDYIKGTQKNQLTDVDGATMYSHQLKYSSGNYRNFVDDYYSTTTTWEATEPAKVEFTNLNTFNMIVKSTSLQPIKFQWKTVASLQQGKTYFFDVVANTIPLSASVKVEDQDGKVVASSNSVLFSMFNAGRGVHTVTLQFSGVYERLELNYPRLHLKSETSYPLPARNSTNTGFVVAYNVRAMLDTMETGIISDTMTEAQARAALASRNLKSIFQSWNGHDTSTTARILMVNSTGTGTRVVGTKKVTGAIKEKTFDITETANFINDLHYRKVGSSVQMWAVYFIESTKDFTDNLADLNGKWFSLDKTSLSLGFDMQPKSSKDIINTGTANAFPYLKIWKKSGADNLTVTFKGKDYSGRDIVEPIVIRNLAGVTAGQHVEVDCDLKEIVKVDEAAPANSRSWNIWSTANRFPTMKVGTNTISVDNADKVEIEWRTRRI